tara:strand:+ start:1852 stop:3009 length:1158 start_codon:yes stop_codon:yes gene_type:complete
VKFQFADVVNLNADASCLSVSRWLSCLEGGENSCLYKWLDGYRQLEKKINLGATGATLADIAIGNPEAITLIKNNPEIFEVVGRPYAHDIATTRSSRGFEFNMQVGLKVIKKLFNVKPKWYLPPEFMVTPQQISLLSRSGFEGIFILPGRFSERDHQKLPATAFKVRGTAHSKLSCLPCKWSLTKDYLSAIQGLVSDDFYTNLRQSKDYVEVLWRDGESPFLLPDTEIRERNWLEAQPTDIERVFLSELNISFYLQGDYFYPLHSFQNWMEDLKLLGYLHNLQIVEKDLENLSLWKKVFWLELIGSDILSSIEKPDPIIQLKDVHTEKYTEYVLERSHRYYEAQDLAHLLELNDNDVWPETKTLTTEVHRLKVERRLEFFSSLEL